MADYKKMIMIFGLSLLATMSFGQQGGHGNHGGRMHGEDWPEGLELISTSGVVYVDSSFGQPHIYLDTNSDNEMDYQLGLGPWWYVPESGAVRPLQGENVTIVGGVIDEIVPPMLVVFELNGLVWRDSTGNPPWSGGWAHQGSMDSTHIYCPSDSSSSMGIPSQGMMGMGYPDSIYCQFEQLDPDSMPGAPDSSHFAGFQCAFLNPSGNHMGGGMGHGGSMGFSMNVDMRLHYDQEMLEMMGLHEESITLWAADDNGVWEAVPAYSLNLDDNIVGFSSGDISPYYLLQAQSPTSIDAESILEVPSVIELVSVFPNPFNPTVTLNFSLKTATAVNLRVFDIKGSLVSNQNFGTMNSGDQSVSWSPSIDSYSDLPGGVYLVQLEANNKTAIQKVTYLK